VPDVIDSQVIDAAVRYVDCRRAVDDLPRQLLPDTTQVWTDLLAAEDRLRLCVSRMRSGAARRGRPRPRSIESARH
jgi:hypothetical protein